VDYLAYSRIKSLIMRQVRQMFPDPADAFAALDRAAEELERKNGPSGGVRAAREALDDLMAESGPEIRLGIRGALAAGGFGDLDSAGPLRDLFRRAVLDFASVGALFGHILENYPGKKVDEALGFLERAMGEGLADSDAGPDKARLENANANLGLARLAQSAYARCETVMNRWHGVHGVGDCPLDPKGLLGMLLALADEKFPGASDFERIAREAAPPDVEREVLFLQELLSAVRSFPTRLYGGAEGSMKILGAVQEATDRAIGREDEFLESQREPGDGRQGPGGTP
jgi:type III secretion protein W